MRFIHLKSNVYHVILKNCDLEMHIIFAHKDIKGIVESVTKSLFLKRRLLKHVQIHSSIAAVKRWHYFNNNKQCPYEEIVCMCAYVASDVRKFGEFCANNLCSYQHSTKEEQSDDFTCQQCEIVLKSHNLLLEHVGKYPCRERENQE
jgi:hypothetical protein